MTFLTYRPWTLARRWHVSFVPAESAAASTDTSTAESSNSQAGVAQSDEQRAAAPRIAWLPAVDVRESEDRFVVRADLPGVDAADIEITAQQGVLTLRGERRAASAENTEFARRERATGYFLRRFELPESANADAIKATHLNGVLEVVIPKQPKPEARRIKIEAA